MLNSIQKVKYSLPLQSPDTVPTKLTFASRPTLMLRHPDLCQRQWKRKALVQTRQRPLRIFLTRCRRVEFATNGNQICVFSPSRKMLSYRAIGQPTAATRNCCETIWYSSNWSTIIRAKNVLSVIRWVASSMPVGQVSAMGLDTQAIRAGLCTVGTHEDTYRQCRSRASPKRQGMQGQCRSGRRLTDTRCLCRVWNMDFLIMEGF